MRRGSSKGIVMTKYVGILTSGGDCPGLNAAIRGFGKAAIDRYGMEVIGFRDGFRGLMQDRTLRLDDSVLSGILTDGGTILGTSRDKPHRMDVGGKIQDMTDVMIDTYHKHHLDALVCLGGGGTQKNAMRLAKRGLNVVTLPKTIDNDVSMTDVTFGFDTAAQIATEAIDRLHSTATSHNRIIVVEIMGHNTGWLALAAGSASGADVILIPEIPYDEDKIAKAILRRSRSGKRFSIVAVAEGAMSAAEAKQAEDAKSKKGKSKKKNSDNASRDQTEPSHLSRTYALTRKLEKKTRIEARLTILGHLQRGGTPSAYDRALATRLGVAAAKLVNDGEYGVMVAARGDSSVAVPLKEVAGNRKVIPQDHPWIEAARCVGTCFGD